jgi:cysteine desulfurase / selenocysteine lyase
MIYLDNAATSWPKPPVVLKAMADALEKAGGNPGRSGHRLSIAAARIMYNTRDELAGFFGVHDPLRVIFTANATHALNLALNGLLKPGDRVLTTSMDHNAVRRPLRHLERRGIGLDIVPCIADGSLNVSDIVRSVNSATKLVIITHASNVVGTILPVTAVAEVAHQAGAMLLVDAAQTAGVLLINMTEMGIDLLAFTGHKELLGPPGIGGLVMADTFDISRLETIVRGGTGSLSELEEQPEDLPDKYESGTANLVGIAGLGAGLRFVLERGIDQVNEHFKQMTRILVEDLSVIPGVRLYGTLDAEQAVSVVSFTAAGRRVSEIGMRLDEEFGILSRVGLHCAPAAHRTIGSFPEGTVRLSPGIFTTVDDIKKTVQAISEVIKT